MPSGRVIAAVLIAAAIAGTLFVPFNAAVTENTGAQTVTNESVTASVGESVELDGYNIQSNSETVYWFNSSDGDYEEVTSGTDYEMNYSEGAIYTLSGGSISDGDDLKVTYTYDATDGTTSTVVQLTPLLLALLILVVLAKPMMAYLG